MLFGREVITYCFETFFCELKKMSFVNFFRGGLHTIYDRQTTDKTIIRYTHTWTILWIFYDKYCEFLTFLFWNTFTYPSMSLWQNTITGGSHCCVSLHDTSHALCCTVTSFISKSLNERAIDISPVISPPVDQVDSIAVGVGARVQVG